MIHGDNQAMDHSASDGCIVLNATLRKLIQDSDVRVLVVVDLGGKDEALK